MPRGLKPPPAIRRFLPAASTLLTLDRDPSPASHDSERVKLRRLAGVALDLAAAMAGDLVSFAAISEHLSDSHFAERLLDLPTRLSQAHETELALSVAQAFEFIAPDKLRGDRAVALAEAGRRDEAVAQIALNLERPEDRVLAEAKAGDAYRALGEDDAAEAYYRRSLAEARTSFERSEAILRIVSLLSDGGRERAAAEFLAEERHRPTKA